MTDQSPKSCGFSRSVADGGDLGLAEAAVGVADHDARFTEDPYGSQGLQPL
ncbi:hypothetical protein [Nocardia brasiliensis]|uniref:hypothetical protein n=1 Tax=Nocardia brasiliensis TaxID=37326 RepID=UPI0024577BAE|nr:hypothetical protein [Nocardia brasiliensis]